MQNSPSKKSNTPLIIVVIAAVVLLIGVGLLLVDSGDDSTSPAQVDNTSSQNVTVDEDIPYPNVERISVDDAHIAMQSGTALIVDVRDAEFYESNHAMGAISMPEDDVESRMNELPKDQLIITYCT